MSQPEVTSRKSPEVVLEHATRPFTAFDPVGNSIRFDARLDQFLIRIRLDSHSVTLPSGKSR